jgi:hypothetical protein
MSEMGESTTKELDSATPEALGKRARTAEAPEPDVPPAQRQKVQVKSNVGTADLSLKMCREMELQDKMERSSRFDDVNQHTFNAPLAALGPNSTERVRGKAGPLEVKTITGKSANGKVEVIIEFVLLWCNRAQEVGDSRADMPSPWVGVRRIRCTSARCAHKCT